MSRVQDHVVTEGFRVDAQGQSAREYNQESRDRSVRAHEKSTGDNALSSERDEVVGAAVLGYN
jgi:hypothetical protein